LIFLKPSVAQLLEKIPQIRALPNIAHCAGISNTFIAMSKWKLVLLVEWFGCFSPNKYEVASRMVLDAVLLSLSRLLKNRRSEHSIAILPEMRIATGDGVLVSNPETGLQMWLTGQADYGVVEYPLIDDNQGQTFSFRITVTFIITV
jgi:hypothetical protein